ncbi:MAG: tetratricopeptide repeat protein, partial [Planctomycetota bacterium]|nr:tetratricopeptide repeat protein [Planctomycetota bacterium]
MERQLSMARLGERHGQTETAHKIYQKVLLQDPDNVEALHRLGVMAAKTQDYETAIAYLTKAEMNDPSNVELLNDLGYALFLTDDLAGAEEKLRLAIRLNPSHRAARNNLGLVLGNAGRWDECMVQFKRAVSEAEAYANLAFVQVQMGEFALAEKNFHSALDLDDELDAAAEGLVQILAKKDMLEKRFIADFNEQSAKPSVEHQTVELVPTVVQPLSPSRYQLRASEVSQTPSVVAAKPQNKINSPTPAEAVPTRKKAPEVIAETPLRAEPKLTQQISQGPVTRANRQVILEHKLPFQPRLRHDAIAQTPLTQIPTVEVEAPVVVEAPI